MNIFDVIHRYRKALLVIALLVGVSGIALALAMPVSLFPAISFPRIVMLVDNGEEPAEKMMVSVTKPLEEAVNSVPGVNLVRSKTSRGSAEISISLDWNSNIQQSLQTIQGRVSDIRAQLPASASIQIEKMDVSIFPIQGYSLTSDSMSLADLRDLALYHIRPALMRIRGVARVQVTGGDVREFQVVVSPEKMESFGLSITQICEALQKQNIVESSGLVNNNHYLYLSIITGALGSAADIGSVVVAVRGSIPLMLRDIAEVKPAIAENPVRTTARNRPAVLLSIIKQPGGSTVEIGKNVTTALKDLHLPRGAVFENYYDQSGFIGRSISNTRDSIVIGIVLAMAVLLIFLGSWRITLVVALVVPATISATLLCLYATGKTINIMTLGGIAAAIGLVIDDAIVVIENIFTRFPESKKARGSERKAFSLAAHTSLKEMAPALVGSTASTIVIQIPLLFLGGITGAFFTSLSITMIFALCISFILSITLVPLVASRLVNEKDMQREARNEKRVTALSRGFEKVLRASLRRRFLFIPAALALALATFFLYTKIGSGFMPEMDEGAFVLDYTAPPGTSLIETDRMLRGVEEILTRMPEVESYSRRTGTQLGFFITEPNTGDFLVKLKRTRSRGVEEVISDVRDKVQAAQPSLTIDFGQLIMDVIGDLVNGPSPVEIKLFGENANVLQKKAEEITDLIEKVPGVVDAFSGIVVSGPSYIVRVDPRKAALAGLTAEGVHEQVSTLMQGNPASQVQTGDGLLNIRVLYPPAFRADFDKIESLNLMGGQGERVPLSSIASFERTTGGAELNREGLRGMVAVTARISGRDLGHTITDIKRALASKLSLPRDVSLAYGGLYQSQRESFRDLLTVALLAVALVFIVLLFEFKEFAVPVSILVIIALSLFGVFSALFITRVALNISSFVGIILIIGIVAENAIFLLHTVKILLEKDGLSLDESLIKGCLMRARPILMTTLGAIFAFFPLALGVGEGAQMQQPLAIAVIGGFSVSSLMLFFGLPLMYRLLKK